MSTAAIIMTSGPRPERPRSARRRDQATRGVHAAVVVIVATALVAASPGSASAAPLGGVLESTLTRTPLTTPQALGGSGMSGLQYPDPAAGIDLVQPPEANNQGDAEVSLPLTVPHGRGAMTPDLTLKYSSANGSGWVGMGWSLDPGSVGIDTRWGVPRYLPDKESETYTLDGDMLSPTGVRSTLLDRLVDRHDWHRRVENEFERIVRHGDKPGSYWWEVTDTSGTTRLYGAYRDGGTGFVDTRDPLSILSDDRGNEFRWALRQVRDISGNTIDYHYLRVAGHDVGEAKIAAGTEMYLSEIDYSGSVVPGNADDPAYKVKLTRDSDLGENPRRDVVISAKGGFLEVTSDLLRHVDVYHRDDLVVRYNLGYDTGPFGKSLLTSVGKAAPDGNGGAAVWQQHTFDYYDDLFRGGFADPAQWHPGSDTSVNKLGHAVGSSLGQSASVSTDFRAYLGYNPDAPEKDGSFGGAFSVKVGHSDGSVEMIDINGDNLPDKVFRAGSAVKYQLNRGGAAEKSTTFGPEHDVAGDLPGLSVQNSVEVNGGPGAYAGPASVQFNAGLKVSVGDGYFIDVNADGLADYVQSGTVYFNHLDASGVPTFSRTSDGTAVPIDSGAADVPALDTITQYEKQLAQQSPRIDTIRRWVAPWSGHISIAGDVTFQPPQQQNQPYTGDGVRVAVQVEGAERWSARLGTPQETVTPTNVTDIAVTKGDRVYFRVGSIQDGATDQVKWDPQISYADVADQPGPDGLSQTVFDAARDFTIAGRPGMSVTMPLDGHVSFSAMLHKTRKTSDEVRVQVLHNGILVLDEPVAGSFVGDVPAATDFEVSAPTGSGSTERRDTVEARLHVDSPIDVTGLSWAPDLHYTSATRDGQPVPTTDADGNPTLGLGVTASDDLAAGEQKAAMPTDISVYPHSDLSAPQQTWTAASDGTIQVVPEVQFAGSHEAGRVVLTVKSAAGLIAKRYYDVAANGLFPADGLSVEASKGTAYWFDLSIADPVLGDQVTGSAVRVDGAVVPSARHWAGAQDLFPLSYRGWGYAGYNGEDRNDGEDRENTAIVQDDLRIDSSNYPQTNPKGFDDPNPAATATAYVFLPYVLHARTDREERIWQGPKSTIFGAAAAAQSSRLADDSVNLVGPEGSGVRAVRRLSITPQLAVSGALGVTGSFTWADSLGLLDYVDMNADGFPDVVGPGFIRFTGPRGGYVSTGDGSGRLEVTGNDTSYSVGASFDGSLLSIPVNSEADASTSQAVAPVSGHDQRPSEGSAAAEGEDADEEQDGAKLGFSAEITDNKSNEPPIPPAASGRVPQEQELADMNGDGLPDRVVVAADKTYVYFNTGYGFDSHRVAWAPARFENGETASTTLGPTLGFNLGKREFSGGLSLNDSYDAMKTLWVDINGDGIVDRLRRSDGVVKVAFGTGSGLLPDTVFGSTERADIPNPVLADTPPLVGDQISNGHDLGVGFGFDVTVPIPLCPPLPACYLIVNLGAHADLGVSGQQTGLLDVDGDGYPDSVSSTAGDNLTVRHNLTGRTNLLQNVHNPLGGTIGIDYERKGNTEEEPYSQWVMSRVTVDDGRSDEVSPQVSTYDYEHNIYDPLERTLLGYASVVEKQLGDDGTALREFDRTYRNATVFDAGLLTSETLTNPSNNRAIRQTANTWALIDLATRQDADLSGGRVRLLEMAVAPEQVKTEQRWFGDDGTQQKNTYTTFEYDDLGAPTQVSDIGEPGLPDDDLSAQISYSDCTGDGDSWVHLPATMDVRDGSGHLLRHRDGSQDLCANGAVTHLVESTGNGPTAVTDFCRTPDHCFDEWGNYDHIAYPANASGKRLTVDYTYDSDRHTDIGNVTDSHGLTSMATYDNRFGLIRTRTDANAQVTTYDYDVEGRLVGVTLPYEQNTGHTTISYEYRPTDPSYAWAVAHHFDAFHPDDPIDTVAFVNGTGRQTETKQDATFFEGSGKPAADGRIVSGGIQVNALGQLVRQWYPVPDTKPLGVFEPPNTQLPATVMEYTLTDLVKHVTYPDDRETSTDYGFGGENRVGTLLFRAHQVDENGKAQDSYGDVRGNVLGIEVRPGSPDALLTRYGYDPLGELTSITDSSQNQTTMSYDLLGRRTSTDTPDGGLITFGYDPASNLIEKVTPNLRAAGQKISYGYDVDRLTSIDYPNPTQDVRYTYGAAAAPNNGAGRLIRVQDAARDTSIQYGRMGDVGQEQTTMLLHNLSTDTASRLTFTTSFSQDSFGRYRTITYPDGEVLRYDYDSGGLPASVVGDKDGTTYHYVDRMEYDEFLAKRYQLDGNGVSTETSYNPLNRRVTEIHTLSATRPLQDLNYRYDKVGNVTDIDNALPAPVPGLYGGPSTQHFDYDTYYRLDHAEGSYDFGAGKTEKYLDDFGYDNLGNLLQKAQTDTVYQPGSNPVVQAKTTYTEALSYGDPSVPHAVTAVGNLVYTHDADGNFTGWTDTASGQRRTVTWDAADRMTSVADQGSKTTYTYDDAGRLAIDRGPLGETAFVNQWYTVENGTVAWKHVWLGGDRVATQRVYDDGTPEDQRHFLHKDLQGNTNMVTAADGSAYEHLEYFPGGEAWIFEHSDTHRTPYTFIGSYFDEVRGLNDLGRRWYEPREQFLYSPEPALADEPTRAVDDPALLSAYSYAEANPLRLTDRDGRIPRDVQAMFMAAFGRDAAENAVRLAVIGPLAFERLTRFTNATSRIGGAIAEFAEQAAVTPRAVRNAMVPTIGPKPLLEVQLIRTRAGLKVGSIKLAPVLFIGQFILRRAQ